MPESRLRRTREAYDVTRLAFPKYPQITLNPATLPAGVVRVSLYGGEGGGPYDSIDLIHDRE